MIHTLLSMNQDEARIFLRKMASASRRIIEGEEYDKLILLILLAEPTQTFNIQRRWTDRYLIGDTEYDAIYEDFGKPTLEEILKD